MGVYCTDTGSAVSDSLTAWLGLHALGRYRRIVACAHADDAVTRGEVRADSLQCAFVCVYKVSSGLYVRSLP